MTPSPGPTPSPSQRRESRAEWLRIARFDQYVELDRRLRELVASAARGFGIADAAAVLQVQAREEEQEGRRLQGEGADTAAGPRFQQAIDIHRSILDLAPSYHEARSDAQSQLRQLELDMGRYALLLSPQASDAVARIVGRTGDWLSRDPTKTWALVAELEAREGLTDQARVVARRAERERLMEQDHVDILRRDIAIAQQAFLEATMVNLRIPRSR